MSSPVPNRNIIDSRVMRHLHRRFNLAVAFQKLTDVPDLQGGSTRTWADFVTVIGALEPLSAEERLARGATQATGLFTLFVDFRTDVDVRNRVRIGARLFDIKGQTDLGEQQLMLALDVAERFVA